YESLVRSRLAVRSGRAYVTVGHRLYVYDLSDETRPVALQSTDLGGDTSGLAWAGASLYVATAGDHMLLKVPAADLLAVSVIPADGALAPVDVQVRVEFSLAVAPPMVTDQTFRVTSDTGLGELSVDGTRDVEFTLHGAVLVFRSSAPLTAGATV